jgi:hypothetical protein
MYTAKNKRHALVILLMTIGGIFIFLATNAWFGYVLVVLGILIELIGIKLEHSQ